MNVSTYGRQEAQNGRTRASGPSPPGERRETGKTRASPREGKELSPEKRGAECSEGISKEISRSVRDDWGDQAHAEPEPPVPAPPKKKRSALRAFLGLLLKLAIVAGIGWALLTYVIDVHIVHTNDMYPAVRDGDLIVTYRLQPLSRGSVICYRAEGEKRMGRIVGVEGDVIEIDENGHYSINGGVPLETVYYETRIDPDADISYPYTVPAGTVFVLNDLRDKQSDSRRFGAIPLTDCDGSAVLLLRRRSW